jgi:hypothetical protein
MQMMTSRGCCDLRKWAPRRIKAITHGVILEAIIYYTPVAILIPSLTGNKPFFLRCYMLFMPPVMKLLYVNIH